ncbi:MAG: DivIVA domain-containing protein [Eggerthellaceae bacterium]|nr:DivIVA domain-containing protein [Eggerthellaceae bacterium]
MAITAADIHNQSFSIDRKGYDVDEVDIFLEHVADEIDLLNNQIAQLEQQLDEGAFDGFDTPVRAYEEVVEREVVVESADVAELEAELAEKDALIAELQAKLDEKKADDYAIAQALIVAQRSADDIIAKANAQAAETVQDARDEAQRILDRANADRQAVLDATRKLQDDREDAREQYADLLNDVIADATRKLSIIGGAVAISSARGTASHAYVPEPAVEIIDEDDYYEDYAPVASGYTTPQMPVASVAAATPIASAYEKDLSGFGDADDFEFEEID